MDGSIQTLIKINWIKYFWGDQLISQMYLDSEKKKIYTLRKMIWKSVDIKNAKNLLNEINNHCKNSKEFINKEFSFENCEIAILNVTKKIF